jgi:hypothetical protein
MLQATSHQSHFSVMGQVKDKENKGDNCCGTELLITGK